MRYILEQQLRGKFADHWEVVYSSESLGPVEQMFHERILVEADREFRVVKLVREELYTSREIRRNS